MVTDEANGSVRDPARPARRPAAHGFAPTRHALVERLARFAHAVEQDSNLQFWALQLVGWLGLCLITFVSLTLWYNTVDLIYIEHTLLQAALGIVLSLIMRACFKAMWNASPLWRFGATGLIVIVASLIWTALRIETYMWITGEENVWADFGGWYFGSIMVFSSWSLAYYGVKFYNLMREERRRARLAQSSASDERLKRLTAEGLAREAQLKMLRYQLNPHFLFNTLNSISSLIKSDRGDDARDMVASLSRFLRFSLDSNPALMVPLDEDMRALRLYLDIERRRFGDRMGVEIDVPPDAAAVVVPSLLLQPIVENSLKFAIAKTLSPGTIRISARRANGRLELRVSDTGPQAEPADAGGDHHERGIGLQNTEQRLKAEYGDDYVMRSEAGASGWETYIAVPAEWPARAVTARPHDAAPS